MSDLESIKVILRSLLVSQQDRITVDMLRRDYREMEGKELPFRAMGYSDFESFLRAIPDTVKVYPNGYVSAVQCREIAHIAKMVALQRPKARKRPRPRGMIPRNYFNTPMRSRNGPSAPFYQSSFSQPSHVNGASGYTQQPQASRNSSAEYQPKHCTSKLFQDSISRLKEPKQLPEHSPNSSGSSSAPAVKMLPERYDDSEGSDLDDSFDFVTTDTKNEDYRDVYFSQDESDLNHVSSPGKLQCDRDGLHQQGVFDDMGPAKVSGKERIPVVEMTDMSLSNISDRMKKNFRSIMDKHLDGIWCCELPDLYENEFGVPLNFNGLGYTSVSQLAHDIPDVFICKRIDSGDWRLFDSIRGLPAAYVDDVNSCKATRDAPARVAKRIQQLAAKYPSGVRIDQFCQLYKAEYNLSLLQEVPDVQSVQTLLLQLQNSVIDLRCICKEYYVYPLHKTPPTSSVNPLPTYNESPSEIKLYPDDVIRRGETYPPPFLSDDIVGGSYMEVLVAEVYNPLRFWIGQRGPNHHLLLDKLMDELQLFYGEHEDKYSVPDAAIVPGQCCAAQYQDEWHRAYITSVISETHVEVMFLDYGTLSKVPKKKLCFMHKKFQPLPAQGLQASLFGIVPSQGPSFTPECNKFFLELCSGKPLVAVVQKVDREKYSFELHLIDTSGEDDVHLNDVLVAEGHATFSLLTPNRQSENVDTPNDRPTSAGSTVNSPVHHPSPGNEPQAVPHSPPAATQIPMGSYPSCSPPPGFQGSNMNFQTGTSGTIPTQNFAQPSGFGMYGVDSSYTNTNFSPFPNASMGLGLNPGLAAGLTGMNPLNLPLNQFNAPLNPALAYQIILYQQQQQQQMALYQMQMQLQMHGLKTALLGSQNKTPSPFLGNPWPSLPVLRPTTSSVVSELKTHDSACSSPTPSIKAEEVTTKCETKNSNKSETLRTLGEKSDLPSEETDSSSSSSDESDCSVPTNDRESNGSSTSEDNATSEGMPLHEKEKVDNKTLNNRTSLTQTFTESTSVPTLKGSHSLESFDSDSSTNSDTDLPPETSQIKITCPDNMPQSSVTVPNVAIKNSCESKKVEPPKLPTSQRTSNHVDPEVVESWEELVDGGDTPPSIKSGIITLHTNSETSSSSASPVPHLSNNSPDCKAKIEVQRTPSQITSNIWKAVDVDGKCLKLFNIDHEGYVSTNDLAQNCTSFSNSSVMVRVLEHKNIDVPYKKLERSKCLPLFASLDGSPNADIENLGLTLNKKGNVVGTLHLTPVGSIPYMLMVLGCTNMNLIKGIQKIRASFDPHDNCWKSS